MHYNLHSHIFKTTQTAVKKYAKSALNFKYTFGTNVRCHCSCEYLHPGTPQGFPAYTKTRDSRDRATSFVIRNTVNLLLHSHFKALLSYIFADFDLGNILFNDVNLC